MCRTGQIYHPHSGVDRVWSSPLARRSVAGERILQHRALSTGGPCCDLRAQRAPTSFGGKRGPLRASDVAPFPVARAISPVCGVHSADPCANRRSVFSVYVTMVVRTKRPFGHPFGKPRGSAPWGGFSKCLAGGLRDRVASGVKAGGAGRPQVDVLGFRSDRRRVVDTLTPPPT